jgi:hypothetical protein
VFSSLFFNQYFLFGKSKIKNVRYVIIFIEKIIPGLMAQFNLKVIYGVLSKFPYDFSFT